MMLMMMMIMIMIMIIIIIIIIISSKFQIQNQIKLWCFILDSHSLQAFDDVAQNIQLYFYTLLSHSHTLSF